MIAYILQAVYWLLLYNEPNIGQSRGSNRGRDRPKSWKQVVSVPLPNARQQVWVSRVLGYDHYKGLAPCHSRCGTLKNRKVGRKAPNIQTQIAIFYVENICTDRIPYINIFWRIKDIHTNGGRIPDARTLVHTEDKALVAFLLHRLAIRFELNESVRIRMGCQGANCKNRYQHIYPERPLISKVTCTSFACKVSR